MTIPIRVCCAISLFLMANGALGQEIELTPNPNPPSNTITLGNGVTGVHGLETFENFGAILVQNGGGLRNEAEMDIIVDEDGNGGGLATIEILLGGVMETTPGSQMNFDSLSNFSVFGVVNNSGNISADWSMQFREGSHLNNLGSVQNKRGATFRGTVSNSGLIINVATPGADPGFMQQIATQFDNLPGATLHNQGELLNFREINNDGTFINEVSQGGIGRGIFRNFAASTVNNSATGEIINQHRWFNFGTMNNSGLITNHIAGLGMSNDVNGEINNLAGGILEVDFVINSNGMITNEGSVIITGTLTTAFGIRGSGSYLQTAGETVVNSMLEAAQINFEAGEVSGSGTLQGTVTVFEVAVIAPGLPASELNFVGDLNLDGTYAAELNSLEGHDSIVVSETLTLGSGSQLNVHLLNGFVPGDLDAFDLVLAEEIVGEFGSTGLPQEIEADFSVSILVDELGTTDVIRLARRTSQIGDVNLDGVVNLLDVFPFVALVISGEFQAEADVNGDGVINLLDVGPFVALLSG